jgi:hypothetical protein
MKNPLAIGLLLLSTISPAIAQTFEGTIRVGLDIQIGTAEETAALENQTKAPLRLQVEKEKKLLEDPSLKPEERAEVEKIVKEHEELLNTPLLKTYTDAKIKGDHMMVIYRGGNKSRLYRNAGQYVFELSHKDKTYKAVAESQSKSWGKSPVLVKTDETETVLNYPCTKYVITSESKGQKSETTIWATPEITDVKWALPLDLAGEDPATLDQIKGTPLKIISVSAKLKTVTEVLSIERATLADEDFLLPPDYKEAVAKGKKKK